MMLRRACISSLVFLFSFPAFLAAANYSVARKTVDGHATYHLIDASRKMEVSIAPSLGNIVYQFKANGKDIVVPTGPLKAYFQNHQVCCGIPFLAPWANRINHEYYFFQNRKYLLNDTVGNILHVPPDNLPIHGTLLFNPHWKVIESGASDSTGAYITSRLEYYKYPDLMEQFPFAETYRVTYRLKDGKLENTTEVVNLSRSAMPVFYGYHPYFRPDGPREDWTVSIQARKHWKVDNHKRLISTGETGPTGDFLPHAADFKLGGKFLDDAFSDLKRDSNGFGHYWVKGKSEKVELVFGKGLDFGHVYAPLDNGIICMEPETAVTNAFNLNHQGKFPELIVLEPGKTFKARFWIIPSGY